jgi:peptide chain release factor subunit 1
MVGYSQIEELLQYDDRQHPVMSLYLNLTPPRNFTTELRSLVHAATKELKESGDYNENQLREFGDLLETLENHVRDAVSRKSIRFLVIFASSGGLWREFGFPVALQSRIVVEATPYVRPLTILLDEFYRYCVVVTNSSKARIFSLYMGEFEEHPDVFIQSDVPDRVNVKISITGDLAVGARGGLGAERIQRHVKDHIHRHLKYVAEKTFKVFREEKFDKLIIAGARDKVLPWFQDHLHSHLKDHLIGQFYAHPEDNGEELKEKALQEARKAERLHEQWLIEQLMDQKGPGGKAVLGTEPTLEALLVGQVHTLIIRHDFKENGYTCPSGHILSTHLKTCPLCGQPMKEVLDLGEEMVEEALSQGAEIEHVFASHEGFNPYGVGALLRFTI